MNEVVRQVDFGKEGRESARRFCRLLNILEEYAADVLRDPVKHIDLACVEISTLRQRIREAQDALRTDSMLYEWQPPSRPTIETIVVPKDEWERLLACAALVQKL